MKRMIVFILLALLLLSACSSETPPQNESSSMKVREHIEDKKAYDEYVKTESRLPDHFVTWDDVSLMGDVYIFTISYELYHGKDEITQYRYAISDGNTSDLTLDIDHDPETSSIFDIFDRSKREKVAKPANLESMKKIPVEQNENGYVVNRNGLDYNYNKWGEIISICWYEGGIQFKLSGQLLRYPENPKPSFVTKLLSAVDAEANQALAELKQSLTK